MFSTLYENRDKKISQLVKLGDCLGRALRENIVLFSIDGANEIVTYITENDKVISGNYNLSKGTVLNNIRIQDSSIFKDDGIYQDFINQKVSGFVKNIYEDDYSHAESNFGEILSLWENRLKFDNVQKKLHEKVEKFNDTQKILESEEFKRFIEIQPQIINFLKNNFKKISKVPEIKNAVNLSNTISEAFNIPRVTYETLVANKSFTLTEGTTSSIYDMICRQELVKKELLESKKEFDTIWASNSAVQKLASCIFEEDDKVIQALSEAIHEVPYLALASKNNLYKTFASCLATVDGIGVSDKDIQKYASNIFEAKKEVRTYLINALNEKFGVNVQNLQDPPSFKSLVNTQVIIFETISRLSTNGSVIKKTLSELSESLKNKSGVESIDVNDIIYNMFIQAGYGQILDENRLLSKYATIDFKAIAKDLQDMSSVIAAMKGGSDEPSPDMDAGYESDENLDQEGMEEEMPEGEMGEEEEMGMEEMPPEEGMEEMPPEQQMGEMPPEEGMEGMPPEMGAEMDGEMAPGEEPAEEMPPAEKTPQQIKQDIAKLEMMIKNLADELNMGGQAPEEEEVD